MAEDDISGEIAPVEFTFIRSSLHKLYPLQFIYYTYSACLNKISQEEAWIKAQGNFYRGVYCDSCKKKEEKR